MGSKKRKQVIGTISQLDLIKHSPNKLNRSMQVVRQGTGVHRDKKKYNRKTLKQQGYPDGYCWASSSTTPERCTAISTEELREGQL